MKVAPASCVLVFLVTATVVAQPVESDQDLPGLSAPKQSWRLAEEHGQNEMLSDGGAISVPGCSKQSQYTLQAVQMIALLGFSWLAAFLFLGRSATEDSANDDVDPAGGGSSVRSAILDNGNALLMMVIIFGDMAISLEFKDGIPWAEDVRLFVQFHVLTYCFIGGLVSRSPASWNTLRGLLMGVAAPLALNNVLLRPLLEHMVHLEGLPSLGLYMQNVKGNFLNPGVAWYLGAFVCWRLWSFGLAPLWPKARLSVAILMAACGGYIDLDAFDVGKALAFFPVFVLGQLFPLDWVMARLPHYNVATVTAGAMLIAGLFCLESSDAGFHFVHQLPNFDWASTNFCNQVHASTYWLRGLARHSLELTKGLVFLFCLTPRTHSFLTEMGRYSLYPYLLHWYVVNDLRVRLFLFPASSNPIVQVLQWLLALALAVAVNMGLSSRPVRAVAWVFLEPTWLERLPFMRDDKKAAGSGAVLVKGGAADRFASGYGSVPDAAKDLGTKTIDVGP